MLIFFPMCLCVAGLIWMATAPRLLRQQQRHHCDAAAVKGKTRKEKMQSDEQA